MSVLAASDVSDDRARRSWRSWERHDRQSEATWLAMLSWPSIRTPKFDTVVETWIRAENKDNSVVETLSSCLVYRAAITAFSQHSSAVGCCMDIRRMHGWLWMWMLTCMSSAYECPVISEQWCSQGHNLKAKAKASSLKAKTKAKAWTFEAKAKAWTFEAKAKAIVPRPRPLSIRLPQKLRYAVRLSLTAWQDR